MNKILIVDDDQAYLEGMQDVLKVSGYDVDTCNDALKVLEKVESSQPHCVLLDYQMPKMDGQDVLHLVRAKHPKLPVVICSGYIDNREHYFMREGAFDVLIKPFDYNVLFATIRRAISTSEELTPIVIKGYDLRNARETTLRKLIIKALSKTGFNMTRTAQLLGISRQCLIRYVKRYHIDC